MEQKIRKQSLFFGAVLFSIFIGLIVPFHFTHAFAEMIGMYVSGHIIAAGLQIVLLISNLILGLAGVLLNWVLSPYFMSLPYTHGGIVEIGWPIVRDFINMFFILALVVIGLATALRLKEYQAQKALPVLIIIAVLINFTPVICGLIVDASNILMNFFLEEISGLQMMANVFSAQGSNLSAMWDDMTALNFGRLAAAPFVLIAKTLIMIIFSLVTAFILFMYTLLFIMRYVMIWVLVIVSPIAFFSRIFPAGQKGEYLFKSILGWDEWWKQFLEWTLIGVTAAFFLYLGEQLMVVVSAAGFLQGIPPEGGGWVINLITAPVIEFMNVLLPWCVVLAFLFIGWMVAMDTKALGAQHITSTFKKMGKAMGIAGVKEGAGAAIKAGGLIKDTALGSGAGFYGGIKTEKGLGKIKGAVMGAHMGGVSGIKKGTARWYKDKVSPEASKTEKVIAGLQTAFESVKPIGEAAADAAKKEWGFKEKRPEEIDNQEECEAAGHEWIAGECWKKKRTRPRTTPTATEPEIPSAAPVTPEKPEKSYEQLKKERVEKLEEKRIKELEEEKMSEEKKEGYIKGKGITKTPKKRIKKYFIKRKREENIRKIIKAEEEKEHKEEKESEGYIPKKSTGATGK